MRAVVNRKVWLGGGCYKWGCGCCMIVCGRESSLVCVCQLYNNNDNLETSLELRLETVRRRVGDFKGG